MGEGVGGEGGGAWKGNYRALKSLKQLGKCTSVIVCYNAVNKLKTKTKKIIIKADNNVAQLHKIHFQKGRGVVGVGRGFTVTANNESLTTFSSPFNRQRSFTADFVGKRKMSSTLTKNKHKMFHC